MRGRNLALKSLANIQPYSPFSLNKINMMANKIALISLVCMINLHLVASGFLGGGGSSVYQQLYMIGSANRFSGTHMSVVNEYLCAKMNKDDLLDPAKIASQFSRVASAVLQDKSSGKSKKMLDQKVNIMAELIRMHDKRPTSLCEISGQDVMQLADLEVKLMLDDQSKMPDKRKGCMAVKTLVDYYNEQRRSICPKHFNENLLEKINRMEAEHLRRVTGALDGFMELIMRPLGGFSTKTCSLPVDSLQFTNREAGQALLQGLKMVASEEDLAWLISDERLEDDRSFLERFKQVRNAYLVKPCEYFVDQLEERIKTIKLYKSMYSSYESRPDTEDELELGASKLETNNRRFHRAWALFNTCRLLLQKVPTISVSLLDALHYDLSSSQLDNKQIYELIR